MEGPELKLPILMYHQIARPAEGVIAQARYCIPHNVFVLQMLYLRFAGYVPVTMSRVGRFFRGEASLPRRPVAITFDDGYLSTFTHAAPILRLLGMKATIYLVTRHIGGTNRWDEAEGHARAPLMSKEQVLTLARQGFEFGVHGMNHRRLTTISQSEVVEEVVGARDLLRDWLGLPMETFSYPYGDASFDYGIRRTVQDAGFLAAVGTDPGCNTQNDDPLNLRRLFPKSHTDLGRFRSLLGKMPSDYRSAHDYWS